MPDIYLIRHGHVDYSGDNQVTADNELSELGHNQAAKAAVRLWWLDMQALFSSDMPRARQTANDIYELLGCQEELRPLYLPGLREQNIDDMAGYPGPMPSADMKTWDDDHFAYSGEVMWRRVASAWAQIISTIDELGYERVAVVTHVGTINVILRQFMGQVEPARLRPGWIDIDFAGVTLLHYDWPYAGRSRIVRWINDARHIESLRAEMTALEKSGGIQ